MAHDRLMKVSTRVLLLAVLVSASQGLSSCSRPQLPESARDALFAYWESLPSHPGVEHRLIRAWPGEAPAEDSTAGVPLMEIWCVEAEISSTDDPSVNGDLLVWIVTRENEETRWSAALLASMSSTWPYQACGQAP